MKHIMGNFYFLRPGEERRIELAKMEYELGKFGRCLAVGRGESQAYWEFGILPEVRPTGSEQG